MRQGTALAFALCAALSSCGGAPDDSSTTSAKQPAATATTTAPATATSQTATTTAPPASGTTTGSSVTLAPRKAAPASCLARWNGRPGTRGRAAAARLAAATPVGGVLRGRPGNCLLVLVPSAGDPVVFVERHGSFAPGPRIAGGVKSFNVSVQPRGRLAALAG